MCKRLDLSLAKRRHGIFLKGNEPYPMMMRAIVAPCKCGKKFWARIRNGTVWVECEPAELWAAPL